MTTGELESAPVHRADPREVAPGGFGSFKLLFPDDEVNDYHLFRHEITLVWRDKDDDFGR